MPGLSDQARFETLLVDGPRRPGAGGDGQAAMALAIDLFERAGPRLGCRFVESCYLIALGDLRPNGSWNGFIREPQDSDGEVLDALNRELVARSGLAAHLVVPKIGPLSPRRSGLETYGFALKSPAALPRPKA